MGNCFSEEELVDHEDWLHHDEEWEEEEEEKEKKVYHVKVRMTAKEFRELVAQAESGNLIGSMLLSKGLVGGNFEVKEWSEWEDGGRRKKEMKRLETIKEEES